MSEVKLTLAEALGKLLDNEGHGEVVHTVLVLLSVLPKDVFVRALARVDQAVSVGPLLNPSAFLRHGVWDRIEENRALLQALNNVRQLMPDTPAIEKEGPTA